MTHPQSTQTVRAVSGDQDFDLKQIKITTIARFEECSRILLFTLDKLGDAILAHDCSPQPQELQNLASIFTADHDTAVKTGLTLEGKRYEVHRFYPDLIYGRNMGTHVFPEESTGIAIARVEKSILGKPCYLLITYEAPQTSAKMVTMLRDYCEQHLSIQPQT